MMWKRERNRKGEICMRRTQITWKRERNINKCNKRNKIMCNRERKTKTKMKRVGREKLNRNRRGKLPPETFNLARNMGGERSNQR